MVVSPSRAAVVFLSTLPARGATAFRVRSGAVRAISIHAPREGSDRADAPLLPADQISIHAPREGSDPTPPPAR